jgi:hypothetical protein
MDFEPLRAGLEQAVPFNQHLGLEVTEVALGRGVVRLPDHPELRNHTGTHHASALFALGQAAAGAAVAAAFVRDLPALELLPQGSEITYKKVSRGPIVATGLLGADADELHATLDRDGCVEFAVDVAEEDGAGAAVAAMTVHWLVRRKES